MVAFDDGASDDFGYYWVGHNLFTCWAQKNVYCGNRIIAL
jgi:hypothetical protein